MKAYIKYIIIAIVVLLSVTLFYNKVYIPKTTFEIISPTKGELKVSIRGIGNVGAKNIYAITAQTGGKILALHTDIGKKVKKGELLIEMDGVDLPAQLSIARASLQKANYDIKASQSELLNQKAQKKLLQITYERYAKLKEQKFASQAEFDKAKAELDGLDAAISASNAHINSAKAAALIASRNIDALKTKIDRLKVYAPVDGYVISKNAEVAQNILPATPILEVVDVNTLWVETKIDERISSKIKVGQDASITLRSRPNIIYKGKVKRVNVISDAVTLEREIDVAFINIPEPFYINEQAEVKIEIKTFDDVVKVPLKVLVQNAGLIGVWVLKDSKAHFVAVHKIAQNDKEIAVENLTQKTKLIVPDSHKKPLKDGMKIHL